MRERAAEDVERFQLEAHEAHRAARAEIVRASEEARVHAERLRGEARAAVERAREEVNTLAARRDDINRQLGRLSGVIEALSVPEQVPVEQRYVPARAVRRPLSIPHP